MLIFDCLKIFCVDADKEIIQPLLHPLYYDQFVKDIDMNKNLDYIVDELISKTKKKKRIDNDDELLKEIYYQLTYYIDYSFDEKYKDDKRPQDDDWYQKVAYQTLKTGEGSCYCFSATFAIFAKKLGYNVEIVDGSVTYKKNGEVGAHYWNLIDSKIYDTAYDATPEPSPYKDIEYFGVNEDIYDQKGAILTVHDIIVVN